MFSILQTIAERKIQQAMAEGNMPDLSHWHNKPLPPDDIINVPPDLRMAYRLQKEILHIEQVLTGNPEEKEKLRQLKRVSLLKTRPEQRSGAKSCIWAKAAPITARCWSGWAPEKQKVVLKEN